MKIINIGGRDITVSHEVVVDPKSHHVSIHCKFSHEQSNKSIEHILTVGGDNEAPVGLTKEGLQKTLNDFKQRHGEIFSGKLTAYELASALED